MLFGTFVQTIVLVIITYRTDWDEQVLALVCLLGLFTHYENNFLIFRCLALFENMIKLKITYFDCKMSPLKHKLFHTHSIL
jgi:hypothetical protein